MNKKTFDRPLQCGKGIFAIVAAISVATSAMASSLSLQTSPSEIAMKLDSQSPIRLSLQAKSDAQAKLISERLALVDPRESLKELILDGPPPPEPKEPAQPKVLDKLRRATKPVSVPAISKTTTTRLKSSAQSAVTPTAPSSTPTWVALGPAPIPNGQTEPADSNGISLTQAPVSGRTISIAIDPTDANTAYVGTAQGGLYRTTNGGSTWTPLLDNALSLAVGSIVFDPTDTTYNTLLVGTGESNFSGDSYAGVGVYKITGAKGASPVLSGPYNQDAASGFDIMTHRGAPGLAVDPNNHNTVYVGTATGQQGIGPQPPTPGSAPNRGLYRSINFFSAATPTFTKIPMLGALEPTPPDYRVTSIVYEPGSSDRMFVGIADASGNNDPLYYGGIYYTMNASAANPTFTRVFETNAGDATTASPFSPIKLAARKIGNTVTVVAITAEPAPTDAGRAYKLTYNATLPPVSPTFTEMTGAQGFGGGQASYDLGVDIDANNANNIYISGTLSSSGDPRGTFIFTNDGGATWFTNTYGLHVDGHMAGVAPSNGSVVYTGTDGGIWKSINGVFNWSDINTPGFSATQFQSIALHPIDRNFSIGGTQDNGTEFLHSRAFWSRADFGDGGYALIDQTSTDPQNVTMYHTYYNLTQTLIGFSRVKLASCATEGQWAFRGAAVGVLPGGDLPIVLPAVNSTVCDGSPGQNANGISLADDVNFYAPMALGPTVTGSTGQVLYFGTDKLYRSIDQGDNMVAVSQILRPPTPPATANKPISAIAISPQNDNVRVVGTNDGHVFATTLGSPALVDVTDANMPGKYIGRIAFDPNNQNIVYVGFNGNAIQGKHVWKGNLSGFPTVTWTALDGASFPDISVNAIAVDPQHSSHIYAGTDRGVYFYDAGAGTPSWSLYGTGLPNVQVFDLAIQNPFRILRAATHGRGYYEVPTAFRVNALSAVSRKVHGSAGTFDISLPVSGTTALTNAIECRSGGATGDYQIVVSFGGPVTFTTAAVMSGNASVSNTSGSGSNTATINLTGVANAQTVVVQLNNVSDGTTTANVAVEMGVLAGDTTGNGAVNSSDISQTQAQSGQPVDGTNFREDVTVNGSINSSDISLVQAASGTALP